VGELRIEHGDYMAPRREGAAELVDTRLPRQLRHEMVGNEVAKLPENAELRRRWTAALGCFFHTLPSGRFQFLRPSLFSLVSHFLWDGCDRNCVFSLG